MPSITETLSSWGKTPVACTRFCERPDLCTVGGTKDPDVDAIVRLSPDLVVVDAEENRREDFDDLVSHGLDVYATRVTSLEGLDGSLRALALRVGVSWTPGPLLDVLPIRARAFVPIWRRPWMALGAPTYATSLLAHLGVANVFDDAGPYPTTTLEAAAARRPDVVVAPSEPYPFTERQRAELESVAPTIFVDGKDLFWWGTRTPIAVKRLAGVLSAV